MIIIKWNVEQALFPLPQSLYVHAIVYKSLNI